MNAKSELLKIIPDTSNILCAYITYMGCDIETNCYGYVEKPQKKILLKKDWDNQDMSDFLNNLNFEYDDDFGCQELFGYVWMTDGTWLERHEYDGAENWEHKKRPVVPDELEVKL